MELQRATVVELERAAHKYACTWSTAEMADYVVRILGGPMAAIGAGLVDKRPLRTWLRGESEPRGSHFAKLQLLCQATYMLAEGTGPHVARAFFRGSNPLLEDRAPLEVIADEEPATAARLVLGAIRQFLEE